jgi:acetyl esterase
MSTFSAVAGAHLARALFALPSPLLERIAGRPPVAALDLEREAWLIARLETLAESDEQPSVADKRANFEARTRTFVDHARLPVESRDVTLPPSIPARVYTPRGAVSDGPLVVYYHGGGWVIGSLDSHDRSCRWLAHLAGVRVVAVDYRLAPEHRFPAAVEDAVAAYAYIASHPHEFGADPARLAVAGDSAGGNLAAVVAQSVHDAGVPAPALQCLIYPATDLAVDHPSVDIFARGYGLTKRTMEWYKDHYVPDHPQRRDPRASPIYAEDLSGLPRAYIATAVADPLRDEGEAYAARLREAGVPVNLQRHPHIHGFFNMTPLRTAKVRLAVVAGAVRQGLA